MPVDLASSVRVRMRWWKRRRSIVTASTSGLSAHATELHIAFLDETYGTTLDIP